MDLTTFRQRLKKFKDAKVNIQEEGLITTIEYQGVLFSGKKYGPLWDLFKRYREDKITDKDLKYIEILEVVENDELEPEIIDDSKLSEVNKAHLDLFHEFRNCISHRIKITYLLYKEHTSDVTGTISGVRDHDITIFDISGAERTIAFADIIKYRIYKKD